MEPLAGRFWPMGHMSASIRILKAIPEQKMIRTISLDPRTHNQRTTMANAASEDEYVEKKEEIGGVGEGVDGRHNHFIS